MGAKIMAAIDVAKREGREAQGVKGTMMFTRKNAKTTVCFEAPRVERMNSERRLIAHLMMEDQVATKVFIERWRWTR